MCSSSKKRGLSLIEVLVGITMFLLIVLAFEQIFTGGYRNLRKVRLEETACFLAQERIEELLRDEDFFPNPPGVSNYSETSFSAPYDGFSHSANVTYGSPFACLADINVTVYWNTTSGVGGRRSFSVHRLYHNDVP